MANNIAPSNNATNDTTQEEIFHLFQVKFVKVKHFSTIDQIMQRDPQSKVCPFITINLVQKIIVIAAATSLDNIYDIGRGNFVMVSSYS